MYYIFYINIIIILYILQQLNKHFPFKHGNNVTTGNSATTEYIFRCFNSVSLPTIIHSMNIYIYGFWLWLLMLLIMVVVVFVVLLFLCLTSCFFLLVCLFVGFFQGVGVGGMHTETVQTFSLHRSPVKKEILSLSKVFLISKARTLQPLCSKCSHKCRPRNPPPPITRQSAC